MTGLEFYEFLRGNFIQDGQDLCGNFTFHNWHYKPRTGTFSFSFNIPRQYPKAIPRDILIAAWDANIPIDDNWMEENFDLRFHNDCRLYVLNFLLNEFGNLR